MGALLLGTQAEACHGVSLCGSAAVSEQEEAAFRIYDAKRATIIADYLKDRNVDVLDRKMKAILREYDEAKE
jgi:hypothetical protein